MADLLHTVCFRATTAMRDELRQLADEHRRKVGDVVRLLLEQILEFRRSQREAREDHGQL